MSFQYPWLLILLAPMALLGWAHHRRSLSAIERRRFPLFLLALACLVAALANPYWSKTAEKQVVRGVDYVVILDVSQSMYSVEGRQRRIDRAIQMLNNLLPRLSGSSAGLIYFAGEALIGCPLTPDLNSLPLFLESVTPGMTAMGTRSSPLPQALEEILRAREAQRQTIGLLFSDGEFSDRATALESWVQNRPDFTLFTLLCGKERSAVPELALDLPHPGAFSQPDPKMMESLAQSGGGSFFDLTTSPVHQIERALLSGVGESIRAGRYVPDYNPAPFLVLAALLIALYRMFPAASRFQVSSRAAQAATLAFLLIGTLAMKNGEDPASLFSSALKDTRDQKYDEAEQKLRQLKQQGASEEIEIALGNLSFAKGNYDEAIEHFSEAVRRNPSNDRARWNWEVALKRKSNQSPPSPPPQTEPPPPQQLPQNIDALLKYFDQLEKEQIRQNNDQSENQSDFAW